MSQLDDGGEQIPEAESGNNSHLDAMEGSRKALDDAKVRLAQAYAAQDQIVERIGLMAKGQEAAREAIRLVRAQISEITNEQTKHLKQLAETTDFETTFQAWLMLQEMSDEEQQAFQQKVSELDAKIKSCTEPFAALLVDGHGMSLVCIDPTRELHFSTLPGLRCEPCFSAVGGYQFKDDHTPEIWHNAYDFGVMRHVVIDPSEIIATLGASNPLLQSPETSGFARVIRTDDLIRFNALRKVGVLKNANFPEKAELTEQQLDDIEQQMAWYFRNNNPGSPERLRAAVEAMEAITGDTKEAVMKVLDYVKSAAEHVQHSGSITDKFKSGEAIREYTDVLSWEELLTILFPDPRLTNEQ